MGEAEDYHLLDGSATEPEPRPRRIGCCALLGACVTFGLIAASTARPVALDEPLLMLAELQRQQQQDAATCGGENWTRARDAVGTELPVLQVHGGKYLKRDARWVDRVCTAASGPSCSDTVKWAAERLVLCVDDDFFSLAKMHTRGHTSSLLPKHQFALELYEEVIAPLTTHQ